MSRLTHVLAVFGFSSVLAGATIAACGARPGAPGEMPPVAPRPTPADPSGAPDPAPGLRPTTTRAVGSNAGSGAHPMSPGPVSVRSVPSPAYAAAAYGVVTGEQAPRDAGASDGYSPPLPPIPDGGVPMDSRLEPRQDHVVDRLAE